MNNLDGLNNEYENQFALNHLELAEKKIFLYIWFMTIDYLTNMKANRIRKINITSNLRIKEILNKNRFYILFYNNRKISIKCGISSLHFYYSYFSGDIVINCLTPIIVQYQDNILVKYSGTNMDLYPDTSKNYDYYEYTLNKNGTINFKKSKFNYVDGIWKLDTTINEEILNYDKIPVQIFSNNTEYKSSFENLQFHIGMYSYFWYKILEDAQIGTNKILLNTRGMPNGSKLLEFVSTMKKVVKQGSVVTDQMLQINPNSNNPLDRIYGSLQVDQLMYGQRMTMGTLKEMMFVNTGGNSKVSTQQNDSEIMSEAIGVSDDDEIIKNILENQYQEFIDNLIRFDILYLKNEMFYLNEQDKDIKVSIELAPTIFDLRMKEKIAINNNKLNKGEPNGSKSN